MKRFFMSYRTGVAKIHNVGLSKVGENGGTRDRKRHRGGKQKRRDRKREKDRDDMVE